MSIPMQMAALPQLAPWPRTPPSLLQALTAGQVLDAKVIGPGAGGTTRLEIQGQLLNLLLPQPPAAGDLLKLKVEAVTPQVRLSLQSTTTGAPQAIAASGQPAATGLTAAGSTQVTSAPPPPAPAMPGAAAPPLPTAAAPTVASGEGATTQPVGGQRPVPTASVSPAGAAPTATAPEGARPILSAPQPSAAQQQIAPAPTAVARPVPAPSAAPMVSTTPAPPSGPAPPLAPNTVTAAQALTQMVQAALPRQGAVTDLTAVLAALVGRAGVPEPVVKAAQQVLATRLDLGAGGPSGAGLKDAIANSGLFSQSRPASPGASAPTDGKTALLTLRSSLGGWLGSGQLPVAATAPVPPPLRSATPRARVPDVQPPGTTDTALPVEDVGRKALDRTEAALARLRLHQHAGLPDSEGRPAPALTLDLPVLVGSHQALLHIQIRHEAESREGGAAERGWQMRFAINLPAMGEVGAQVSLRGGSVGVMLWATEQTTAAALQQDLEHLRTGLVAAGLQPGSLLVRHGEPASAQSSQPRQHFLDALR